jgi:hypothetical protein
MIDVNLVKDVEAGTDVDCYFAGTFVGCARMHLDQDPIEVKPSPVLRAFLDEEPGRLAWLVDRVMVLRAQ